VSRLELHSAAAFRLSFIFDSSIFFSALAYTPPMLTYGVFFVVVRVPPASSICRIATEVSAHRTANILVR